MKEYNWDKLSIIGHSMGAQVAFVYAGIFPSRIDFMINIDNFKPLNRDTKHLMRSLEDSLENFIKADSRNQDNSEPPAYSVDEMVERLHQGSFKSVSRECAPYLLKRSIQPSRKYPGKFYFTKDGRLKHDIGFNLPLETYVDFAKDLKMPYLVVKAAGVPIIEKMKNYEAVLNTLRESPNFEYIIAESNSHHFHLNEPELISDVVGNFLRKQRKLTAHL